MIYFDSCYLAKLYLMEPDSPDVRARARASGEVVCCLIGWGEVVATLHRHLRDGRLTAPQFRLLSAQVAADVKAGLWTPLPITTELAEAQARRMTGLSGKVFLRAADALHLTCAAEAGLKEIYSSDRHLVAAAPHFGLQPVTL
jgi:predicted nucleic acid-binding protein